MNLAENVSYRLRLLTLFLNWQATCYWSKSRKIKGQALIYLTLCPIKLFGAKLGQIQK